MAEKAEKKPDAAPSAKESEKREAAGKPEAEKKAAGSDGGGGASGLLSKTPVLLGGVMIIEASVLFAGFKFLGGGHPASASGAEITADEKPQSKSEGSKEGEKGGEKSAKPLDKKKSVEVRVMEFKAPNKV